MYVKNTIFPLIRMFDRGLNSRKRSVFGLFSTAIKLNEAISILVP